MSANSVRWARRHALFLLAFIAGLGLRVVTQVAYWPALLFEDSYFYLDNMEELDPGDFRPLGYSIILRVLLIVPELAVVPMIQHLVGLGMGVLIYALLLRWGVRRWLAALATFPVFVDAYQIQIEHMVMSDLWFQAIVLGGLALLVWRTPTVPVAGLVGLILGFSVYVRVLGLPLVIPAILFVLFAARGWRRRLSGALVLALAFAAPVASYLFWYHSYYGEYKLSDMGARVQYARVGRFVDCSQLPIPDYQRPLCPGKPPRERMPPNDFVWHPASPARRYEPPPGMEKDAVIKDFVRTVIVHQPVTFLRAWGHDFLRGFYPRKVTYPPEVPVSFWQFQLHWRDWDNNRDPAETAQKYGSSGAYINEPVAKFLRSYQRGFGYTPGTLLGVLLLIGVGGTFGVGWARRSGMRAVCFVFAASGGGLVLAAAAYEFSWRYQLPSLVLLPVAGVLGLTALSSGRATVPPEEPEGAEDDHQPETVASESVRVVR